MAISYVKKTGSASTTIAPKNGVETHTNESIGEMTSSEPMANVGLSYGRTINLGNYEAVKISVSIHLPSLTDTDSLDATFTQCDDWASNKMSEIEKAINNN